MCHLIHSRLWHLLTYLFCYRVTMFSYHRNSPGNYHETFRTYRRWLCDFAVKFITWRHRAVRRGARFAVRGNICFSDRYTSHDWALYPFENVFRRRTESWQRCSLCTIHCCPKFWTIAVTSSSSSSSMSLVVRSLQTRTTAHYIVIIFIPLYAAP